MPFRVHCAYVKRWIVIGIPLVVAIAAITAHFLSTRVPLHQQATKVLVLKSDHKLLLLGADGSVIHTYAIAIGRGGVQPKEHQGDHRTPEGLYVIDRHKRDSRFHRALHVSYPNDADRERARKLGIDPGGDIMIHGIQNGLGWIGSLHRAIDWTDGCMAVTDPEIEEIWAAVPDGTPVEIRH
jgi:murein L,D-transpeptidase YafK